MDSALRYHSKDGGKVLAYFDHIRSRWPGTSSVVHTDVDSRLRRYSDMNKRGAFADFEYKYDVDHWKRDKGECLADRPSWVYVPMTGGQLISHGLNDELLRKGDPEGIHYRGLYLVNYFEPDDQDYMGIVAVWKVSNYQYSRVLLWPSLDEFDAYFFELLDPDRPQPA